MNFQTTASVPVTQEAEDDIENDGWFPDVVLADARVQVRIDGTITSPRLRAALVEAMATVNDELDAWKLQKNVIYLKLEDVPCPLLDGISRNIHRYNRAVYCLAKANLIERYRDYDSTSEGNKRADEVETNVDDLRRDYRWALSDILGISRTTVDLI